MSNVKCIKCGRIKAVKMVPGSTEAFCTHCKIQFDTVDDGDVGYGDPARHVESKDEYELRRRSRR